MKPRFIDIDGKQYLWRDIIRLRREQLTAYAQLEQPALFQMRDHCRPATQATASDRYLEPNLFEA